MPSALSVAAAALALLLAGCLAPAAPRPGTAPEVEALLRPDVTGATFAAPVLLGAATTSAEPSVTFAPDGTTYVTTPLHLWRSDDGGATFAPVGERRCAYGLPVCEHPDLAVYEPGMRGGGDAALVAAADGTLHWLGLGGFGAAEDGALPYQVSTDRGDTWSTPVDLGTDATYDRQWLARDADGRFHGVWRRVGEAVETRRSDDGGATWTPPLRIAPDAVTGPLVSDAAGRLFLPLVLDDGLAIARSDDAGASWTTTTVAAGVTALHGFPVAAVDAAGTLYLAFDTDPENVAPGPAATSSSVPSVFLAVGRDGGATWEAPEQVSPPDVPALFPWVDAGAPGRVVVAWYEGAVPAPPNRLPNRWNVVASFSTTADLAEPERARLVVTPEPVHLGAICAEGIACTLTAADRSMGDFFEVRIHPDGHAVVAFVSDADVRTSVRVHAARSDGLALR